MTIEIVGLGNDPGLSTRVNEHLSEALARLSVEPVGAEVRFFDDNGPKGGRATRCAITVRVPRRRAIRTEETAVTPWIAFDGAFKAAERRLTSDRARLRDRRRRPKKYYVAKRLLEGESEEERTA